MSMDSRNPGSDASGTQCNIGESNLSRSNSGMLWNLAAIAVAGLNTAAAIEMADLQYDIAKQYLDIAKWWRNYYNNTFRPCEDVELTEAWTLPQEQPLYDTAIGRHKTFARIQFKGIADKSIRCTSAYCTGLRGALLKDAIGSEAAALSALANLGYRNERTYVETLNDLRWRRKESVVHRGRNMIANNIQFSDFAAGIFGDLGRQAAASAGGAIRFLGYNMNRQDTQYPTLMRGVPERTAVETRRASVTSAAPTPAPRPTTPATPPPVITSGYINFPGTSDVRPATQEELERY